MATSNDTKGMLKSNTIQGLILMAIPYVDNVYQYLSALPEGKLPKGAAMAMTGLGWVLALFGRGKSTVKPLKGLL